MFGQPTPFPWWLWVLAGLWTGGLVLRRVWPVGRETGWLLDLLIAAYTGLLAYMTATAATDGMTSTGWFRAGWWLSGAMMLTGAAACALGTTPRGRTVGWGLAIAGVASLAVWLHAPELAVLCAGVGVVGWLRPMPDDASMTGEGLDDSLHAPSPPASGEGVGVRGPIARATIAATSSPLAPREESLFTTIILNRTHFGSNPRGDPLAEREGYGLSPRPNERSAPSPYPSPPKTEARGRYDVDPWLVAVTATVACVAWLGTVEFALRTEAPRAGVSPRLTALPALDRGPSPATPSSGADLLLAGGIVLLAIIDARPPRDEPPEDRPA